MNIIEKATTFCNEFELSAPSISKSLQSETDTPTPGVRNHILSKTIDFLYEELAETELAINQDLVGNRPEIIDGFGDIAFVALNGIYKEFRTAGDNHEIATIKTASVMLRICQANLAKKHQDGSIIYANGKVQKPEGWQPPNYDDLI